MRQKVFIVFFVLILSLFSYSKHVYSAEQERGLKVEAPKTPLIPIKGDYWALIIGIDDYIYSEIPDLETAVNDAKGVSDILTQKYGFKKDKIKALYNRKATRANIENTFYELSKQVKEEDSLLIYYAGHGLFEKKTKLGWWIPTDGKSKQPGTYLPNSTIRDYIGAINSKHTYLVADSCFSGTLFGKSRSIPPLNDDVIKDLYSDKSRWGLTSGGVQPVADGGKEGHSVFAYFFLKILKKNKNKFLIPSQIFNEIMPLVANNSNQRPLSEPIANTGDEGGQFVLRLASLSVLPEELGLVKFKNKELGKLKDLSLIKKPKELFNEPSVEDIANHPRIMILIGSEKDAPQEGAKSARIALEKYFTERRFDLVDPAASKKLHEDTKILLNVTKDTVIAAKIGLDHHAEVIITGIAASEPLEKTTPFESARTNIRLRAIDPQTAKVLVSYEKSVAGVGATPRNAIENSGKRVAELAAEYTEKEILKWWNDFKQFKVILRNIDDYNHALLFQDKIKKIQGVNRVSERNFGGGFLEMDISYNGGKTNLQRLVLKNLKEVKGFRRLNIVASPGNRIVLER